MSDKIVKLAAQLNAEPDTISEDAVALAFAEKYRDELRFDHHRGKWFHWDGNIWRYDDTRLAFCWARDLAREFGRGKKAKQRTSIGRVAFAAGVERLAQTDRAFAVTGDIWNRDPYLLGTPGGTVDLRTGELRPARPEDFINKQTAVAPANEDCLLWLKFLREATKDDQALVDFLQAFFGYCLTGDTKEHAFLFAWGPGGNGKGVLQNTIGDIMGDYRCAAMMTTFTASRTQRHPTELAALHGARLVTASETEEGHAWDETKIKNVTGGDRIRTHYMRQDTFEFKPELKLLIIGNHKPTLRNVDDAMRRRFNMVPFLNQPEIKDLNLETRFKTEWPAILQWMIEGCRAWQHDGLVRPRAVIEATAEYFEEQDIVQQWIDECCSIDDAAATAKSGDLFKSWSMWAAVRGEPPGTAKWLAQTLRRMHFEKVKTKAMRGFKGIVVKTAPGVSVDDADDVEPAAPPVFADYRGKKHD